MRDLFAQMRDDGTVSIVPEFAPVVKISEHGQSNGAYDYEITISKFPQGFDPFASSYLPEELEPFALEGLEHFGAFAEILSGQLHRYFDQIDWAGAQSSPKIFELKKLDENRISLSSNMFPSEAVQGLYHRDPLRGSQLRGFIVFYLISEILRLMSIGGNDTSSLVLPSVSRREIYQDHWEPNDDLLQGSAEFQMFEFLNSRKSIHPDIKTALEQGQIFGKDYEKLYRRSAHWKQWLSTIEDDESLVQAYLRELEQEPFVSRLPMRTLRWGSVSAIGVATCFVNPVAGVLALTAAGVAAAAFDTFLVDKIGNRNSPRAFWSSIDSQ